MSDTVDAVDGFSVLNRGLIYTSLLLAPAQAVAGYDSSGFTSLGFLAFNWYQQLKWYNDIRAHHLHALSLLPVHFNTIYSISYLGGVTSGNIWMGILLGLGTAGVMILNTVAAWMSWATNQEAGYGEYQFFFFGWRTLTDGWHKFILVWQIGDSFFAFTTVIACLAIPIFMEIERRDRGAEEKATSLLKGLKTISNLRYPLIIVGSAAMLLVAWPLILWVELIIQRNKIESETDWIAVWLFIVQVGLLMIPSFNGYFGYLAKRAWSRMF
jgi:hypothetical protein